LDPNLISGFPTPWFSLIDPKNICSLYANTILTKYYIIHTL
jgi:hypothetical protein